VALYILLMVGERTSPAALDLERLEARVDELVRAYRQLREENEALRARQDTLAAEKTSLVEKAELACDRIEAMIARLRTLEETT
jgi:cell division protein ZapB